jgi:hypothetical protein
MLENVFGPLGLQAHFRRRSYEDSVDTDRPITIDSRSNPQWREGQYCWEAKGAVAEEYRAKRPQLLFELNQARSEASREVDISLCMIGKSVARAKPVIVISSEERRSREEARAAIRRSRLLEQTNFELGLLRYPPSGPVQPVTMDTLPRYPPSVPVQPAAMDTLPRYPPSSTLQPATMNKISSPRPISQPATHSEVYFNPNDSWRSTGMRIYIRTGEKTLRKATANAVYSDQKYGYLTAAHAFKDFPRPASTAHENDDDLGIPFDSDSEGGENHRDRSTSSDHTTARSSLQGSASLGSRESYSHASSAPSAPHPVNDLFENEEISFTPVLAAGSSSTHPPGLQKLGVLSSIVMHLDYAIVEVTNPKLRESLAKLRDSGEEKQDLMRTAKLEAKPQANARAKLVNAWTTHGCISGKLVDVPILMRIVGSESFEHVYKFTFDKSIEVGDSGTFVTDAEARELYGLMIGKSKNESFAYIMAAEDIVHQIKANGNWHIMNVNTSQCECSLVEEIKLNADMLDSKTLR